MKGKAMSCFNIAFIALCRKFLISSSSKRQSRQFAAVISLLSVNTPRLRGQFGEQAFHQIQFLYAARFLLRFSQRSHALTLFGEFLNIFLVNFAFLRAQTFFSRLEYGAHAFSLRADPFLCTPGAEELVVIYYSSIIYHIKRIKSLCRGKHALLPLLFRFVTTYPVQSLWMTCSRVSKVQKH